MKTITIQLPKIHLNTYKQYAGEYNVKLNELMESEGFLQLQCISDDVFGSLEGFESVIQNNEELEAVSLSYNEQSIIFIKRVAELLRRTPEELMTSCLVEGAVFMDDYMNQLRQEPNDDFARESLDRYPKDVTKHKAAAQLGDMVKGANDLNCWSWFNIRNASSQLTKPATA